MPEATTAQVSTRFRFQKSILPTKMIFQVGLHKHGACKQEFPFNGCKSNLTEFCYKPLNSNEDKNVVYFDETILQSKEMQIDTSKDAVLYHIMYYSSFYTTSSTTDLTIDNDYRAKYFSQTLAALKQRKLNLFVELPPFSELQPNLANSWLDFGVVWQSRGTLGTLLPTLGSADTSNIKILT